MKEMLQETSIAWNSFFGSAADARRLTKTPLVCYALL
jgi:hypothetical protein